MNEFLDFYEYIDVSDLDKYDYLVGQLEDFPSCLTEHTYINFDFESLSKDIIHKAMYNKKFNISELNLAVIYVDVEKHTIKKF